MAGENIKPKEEEDFADQLLKKQRKAAEQKIVIDTLGSTIGGKPGEDSSVKFAKETLEMQSATIKSLDEARKLTQDALTKAETARSEAQTQLYTYQLNSIKDAEARVQALAAKAEGAGPGKSPFEVYREVKTEADKIIAEIPKSPPAAPSGMSDETQIRLTEMKLEQERLLIQMQMENQRNQKEWDIKMLEFSEASKLRWAEYRDNQQFRQQGIEGFQDIVSSIGDGITKERTGGGEGEPPLEVSISKFPCQHCGAQVPIKHGDTGVICPECETEYEVKER